MFKAERFNENTLPEVQTSEHVVSANVKEAGENKKGGFFSYDKGPSDGSLPLGKNERHFANEHVHNRRQAERVGELTDADVNLLKNAYQDLVTKGEAENPGKTYTLEKLSLIQKLHNREAGRLYDEFYTKASTEPKTGEIKEKILEILQTEKTELENFSLTPPDPEVQAFVSTRDAELEKMKADLEIRWLEKKIWDLHVDSSPDKDALQDELKKLKQGRLHLAVEDVVSALKNEQEILSSQKQNTLGWPPRLAYVTGRLSELNRLLWELDDLEKEN